MKLHNWSIWIYNAEWLHSWPWSDDILGQGHHFRCQRLVIQRLRRAEHVICTTGTWHPRLWSCCSVAFTWVSLEHRTARLVRRWGGSGWDVPRLGQSRTANEQRKTRNGRVPKLHFGFTQPQGSQSLRWRGFISCSPCLKTYFRKVVTKNASSFFRVKIKLQDKVSAFICRHQGFLFLFLSNLGILTSIC